MMARYLVQQPNGLFAIFSTVVDNFTWYDLTQFDAFKAYVHDDYSLKQAWGAVHDIMDKTKEERDEKWRECVHSIRALHGAHVLKEVMDRMEKKPSDWKLEVYVRKGGE